MSLPDDIIVQNVLRGDVNAFESLVTRHRRHVARIVAGHVPYDRAEEVAHDAFVNAYRGLASYKGGDRFAGWLARIAVRCCYDFWREQYRSREVGAGNLSMDSVELMDRVMADTAMRTYQSEAGKAEAQEVLRWAMGQLSPEDRMVVTLTALEEKSVAEAADLLGWTQVNVKVRALRARRKLKDILGRAGITEVDYD